LVRWSMRSHLPVLRIPANRGATLLTHTNGVKMASAGSRPLNGAGGVALAVDSAPVLVLTKRHEDQ
jgi:hypothetical protein